MADETVVRIERMTLRVPGMRGDQAQRLGQEVSELLARGIESDAPKRSLGAFRLNVAAEPRTIDRHALTEQVAQRVLKGLEQ